MVFHMDNLDSESLVKQLNQKEKELYSIQKIGQSLSSTLNLDDLLKLIMKEITSLMNADRSTLYLIDRQRNEIWSKIALKAEVKEIRQKIGVGISGHVAKTGKKINIPDAYSDSRFDPSTDKKTGYNTRSILCLPVWEPSRDKKDRRVMGVVQVLNKKDGYFTEADEGILEAIASEVAVALSNAQLYHQLEKKYEEIDLLYEFEQLLSGENDLQKIFQNILEKTVQSLNGKMIGLIYSLKNVWNLITLNNKGEYVYKILEKENHDILNNIDNALKNSRLQIADQIEKDLLEIVQFNFQYVEAIQLKLEDINHPTTILVYQTENGELETDDRQILGIVEQKISRALQLYLLREKALRQERLSAVGQMMSTIVHDLRSPVNSINGFLELLLEEGTTKEEQEEFSEIIKLEIQSITNMTTEILDFAKGKTNILPRKSSARDIMKRFQPQIEQLFRDSNINLHIDNQSKKLINVDIDKFIRVLYNIAKNAKEALNNKGNFFCKIYDEKSYIVFELADNGPGIPEEIKSHLFDSFVTSGKESGTGLGLAIAKKIIDDHNGIIEIQSKIAKGTTFCIKLPEMIKN
jgi:signal transduction histidine kinase/putative methionine-R-sulfoxide reductase with GAF domain